MDPALHPNPDQFKPERFISEEGKLINREYVIPFGAGM